MNEQKQMDLVFFSYMGFLCLCMICVFITSKIYDHGKAEGHAEGFKEGQVAAMHGQWSYAPQIITTTNMVLTNYIKMIKGVPQSLKMDIKAVPNKVDNGNSFTFTSGAVSSMVFNIKEIQL